MQTQPSFLDILKRPEFVTLLVALAVTGAVQFHLPEAAGLPLPEGPMNALIGVAWSIFLGAVFEGRLRGIDYIATFKSIFVTSLKMRGLYIGLGVAVLGGVLKALGHEIDEATLSEIVKFIVWLVLGKSAYDGAKILIAK